MPAYDKTGPFGRGPMTGGGFGRCGGGRRGFSRGEAAFGAGRGGRGRAFGGGRGGWSGVGNYQDTRRPNWGDRSEADDLRAAAEDLKDQLRAVEERLANVDKEPL